MEHDVTEGYASKKVPLRFGSLKDANANARLTGPCFDTVEFWLRVEKNIIEEASAISDGCEHSVQAVCALADMVTTIDVETAKSIQVEDVLSVVDEFPESSIHCIELAISCLAAAIDDWQRKNEPAREQLERLKDLAKANVKKGEIRTLMVMSGKGGVGKSTVAVNIATSLASIGFSVGLVDVDIHGPSIPTMLGLHHIQVFSTEEGKMEPVVLGDLFNLKVMSLGFLLNKDDDPVIWRGPLKHQLIGQFLNDVNWGPIDFLVVDCPPSTGDEPLSVVQQLKHKAEAILVTTPQDVATVDVARSINFSKQLGLPILGIVENMSGFECPHCHRNTPIFRVGGGARLASAYGLKFLGSIPIEASVGIATDSGIPIVQRAPQSAAARGYEQISLALASSERR